jgi:hypothetical protein
LMLLIGLLVGHWATGSASSPAAATPAPQVIRVEGAAAPATAAPPAATAGGGDSSSRKPSTAKAKDDTTSNTTTKAPKGSVSVKSLTSKKAVDDAVKKGKPISTGSGKLPAKDNKPAGGGSAFEEIG